ncbi:hypothetical protein ACQ86N_30275 [Puia sp. P3]|uniref:hypothetical protein n=1 Tax=Puia sp. P3 TaxID=3423952 RepID=UPI003D67DD48
MKCIVHCLYIFAVAGSCLLYSKANCTQLSSTTSRLGGPLGADLSTLPKKQATKLGLIGGVVVVKIYPGGILSDQTKMRAGFIITRIGEFSVNSVTELNAAMSSQR